MNHVPGCQELAFLDVDRRAGKTGRRCKRRTRAENAAPFQDRNFREAMDLVIPRDIIRDVVMAGFATNGGSVIAPANKFWHNPAVGGRTQNLQKARSLLAKSGYSWDSSGKLLYPG